jgi:hypothetical protein
MNNNRSREGNMHKLTIAMGLLASATSTYAEPGYMLGISHDFGGATGVTFKVLSTNRQDKALVAAGVSYFPGGGDQKFGIDLSAGYNFRRAAATVGWDFLQQKLQVAVGVSDTKKPSAPAPAPEPTPSRDEN